MWTYEDDMILASELRDEHYAVAAYCQDESTSCEEDWNGICDTFYEWV